MANNFGCQRAKSLVNLASANEHPSSAPFFFQQNTRLYLVPCLADGVTSWLNDGRGLIVAIVMTKLECTVLRLVLVTPGFCIVLYL